MIGLSDGAHVLRCDEELAPSDRWAAHLGDVENLANAHFLLVGPLDPDSPDPVPEDYLKNHAGPNFTWVGFRDDAGEIISLADVVTLPSFYREGIPRVLLEAMAMSKPIVTTQNVGCKEVVDEGENGHLVPCQDTAAFAQAVLAIMSDDRTASAM